MTVPRTKEMATQQMSPGNQGHHREANGLDKGKETAVTRRVQSAMDKTS